jgi:hypothetical protein
MQKIYTIVNNPRGTLYSKLLLYSLKTCKTFILVLQPTIFVNNSAKNVIDELRPYLIEKCAQSEWPGTKLLDSTALVYYFDLNKDSAEHLSKASTDLYSWLLPNLPEDLCLIKDDGNPWLVTISHEKDAYLLLSEEEKNDLLLEIPELVVKEDVKD